jgi:hypothetical protein
MSCLGPKRGERDTIKVRRRVDVGQDDGYEKQPRKEYSRWRTGRYDSDEDRSRSNSRDAQGCHAFEKNVRNAISPRILELRPPYQSTTVKPTPTFGWKTTDWHLTPAELGTTCSSSRISHYISRTRLEHLPRGKIDSWSQLHDTFSDNFQGTYAQPGNPWDLRNCKQMKGKSLRAYIRHFSK